MEKNTVKISAISLGSSWDEDLSRESKDKNSEV